MKVTLATHGGLAAGIRRQPQMIDTTALSKSDAAELTRLVWAAEAAGPAQDESSGRSRDAMSYTVTVEDGGLSTVLSLSDTAMTRASAALLDWLSRHGSSVQ